MPSTQAFLDNEQTAPPFGDALQISLWGGAALGNSELQASKAFSELPLSQLGVESYRLFQRELERHAAGATLQAMKRAYFNEQNKAERIRRSLSALDEQPAFRLSAQQWKETAESLEFEEET